MDLGVISLIFIVVAIAIGFWKDINTGLISIAFALILGQFLGGLKAGEMIKMWPTNVFFMLVGLTLLFSIANSNGTLELIARKSVQLSGGRREIIPIIVFFMAAFLAGMGPGNISIAALLAPIVMAISRETKISPILMGQILVLGAVAGGVSPIAPNGLVGVTFAAELGLDTGMSSWISQIISSVLFAIVVYFAHGGHKLRGERAIIEETASFTKDQLITLAGIIALVISVLFFKLNVGFASFFIAVVLLLLKVASQKQAIAGIPWGTIILIGGTGILISVSAELGGIDVMTKALATFMGPKTATAIMTLTSGFMSFFSSASGVVLPTLIPTVTGLSQSLNGLVSPEALVAAIVVGAHMVTPSPLSTMGALAYAGATEEMDKGALFRGLFLWAIAGTIFAAFLAYLGLIA